MEFLPGIGKYVVPLILLAGIALILVVIGWVNRRNSVGTSYFMLMVTMTLWLSFYGIELLTSNVDFYIFISILEYLTMVALPVFWLIYALRYSQVPGWNSPGMLILIIILPIILFMAAATEYAPNLLFNHHSFFNYEPPVERNYERIAWTYIHMAYSILYFAIGTILVIRYINKHPRMAVRQSVLMSLGVLVPWIGNITFILRMSPIRNFDLAPYAFVLSASLLAWGMFYKKFLNLVVLARAAVLDRMADGLIVIDTNNWVVDINPAAQSIFRVQASRVVNFPSENLMRPYPDLLQVLRFQNIKHEEVTLVRGDQELYFDLTINPLVDQKGRPIGRMLILHDITSLKVTELKLKEAKVRAEQADNLKSAFLANMSHEIRTPMNAIIGFTNLLNDPEITEDDRTEFTQHIRNSGNSLLQLIDDIIDISKLDADQIQFTSGELVMKKFMTELYSYYNEVKSEAEKDHVQLSLKIPPEHQNLVVVMDSIRLRQVMRHLLDNAVKFTHQGFIEYGFELVDDQLLKFFVKDSGIGIALEKQGLIFERFGRVTTGTKQEYGGTGLGLALSKALIEKQGGRIWVESVLGRGSTFFFTLPMVKAKDYYPEPGKLYEFEKILHPVSTIRPADLELKPPIIESPKTIAPEKARISPKKEEQLPKMHEDSELSLPTDMPKEAGIIFEPEDFSLDLNEESKEAEPRSILVIVEDQMTYLFIEMVLRPKHFHLIWARNMREAGSYLSGKNPAELVILDISQTNEFTGATIIELRKNFYRRKILALVPFEGSSLVIRAKETGCNGYIAKPIKPQLLIQSLEQLLG